MADDFGLHKNELTSSKQGKYKGHARHKKVRYGLRLRNSIGPDRLLRGSMLMAWLTVVLFSLNDGIVGESALVFKHQCGGSLSHLDGAHAGRHGRHSCTQCCWLLGQSSNIEATLLPGAMSFIVTHYGYRQSIQWPSLAHLGFLFCMSDCSSAPGAHTNGIDGKLPHAEASSFL